MGDILPSAELMRARFFKKYLENSDRVAHAYSKEPCIYATLR
jgi:hypothetical protein